MYQVAREDRVTKRGSPMNTVEALQAAKYSPIPQTVTARDAMLYALGIGFGDDPLDPRALKYVYEKDLEVFPTMAITLCYPGSRPDLVEAPKINMRKTLHVFQGFELFKSIPLGRELVGKTRLTGIYDKGASRGVLWTYENEIMDSVAGERVCLLQGASMCLEGGGAGGPTGKSRPVRQLPDRAADHVCMAKTLPQAALIYRLSGDYNPFHVDPDMARAGGFDRPILHGRCTYGIAGRAIMEKIGDDRGTTIAAMEGRFTSSVFPGETIRTEIWEEGDEVLFRCATLERGKIVLDHGYVRWR
jgi:acyl dehydratase